MITTQETDSEEDAAIAELINQIGSTDIFVRQTARQKLISVGRLAVTPLLGALKSVQLNASWEAAKALGEIKDPRAADALVEAMISPDEGVSWVSADALIALGEPALVPVLKGILRHAQFARFRIGAHRILGQWILTHQKRGLRAVVEALEGHDPVLAAPIAAENALLELAALSHRSETTQR